MIINKTILIGLHKLFLSKYNKSIETFQNYLCAFFKTSQATHPLEIQVEPSSVCNLKCKMCSLNKNTDQKKFLTPKELSKILKKFNPNSVNLTGMGETLLNPHFEQLIKVCSDNNVKTSFITNIQLLNKNHLKAIKKYPPTNIGISMESGYSKNYNSIRAGANLQTTIQKIKELVGFINHNKLPTQVNINIVILDFNLKDLKHIYKIIDLALILKINKITCQNINILSPYIKRLYKLNTIENIFNKIKKYSQSKNIELILPSTIISKGKCYYPWVYPQITANGEVLPCCIIPQFGNYNYIVKKYSFGNILNNSMDNTWNSTKAKNFRLNYQNDLFCRNCTKNHGIL